MTISSSTHCPQCGALISPHAPAGLCPNCLMAMNLRTGTVLSTAPPDAPAVLRPEEIAPHFPQLEILESLGRGGMGVVYRARQKSLNRLVALKLLAPERVHDPRFAERFAREAQALAALSHPNIVTVHDFGQAGGFYFLLMEFVDGVNLRQLLLSQKLTPEHALTIVPALCDALQFAHERGIVHRDIKPENLLLDKTGRVKIADFGIAKILGPAHDQDEGTGVAVPAPATHSVVGTRHYSAPEQQAEPQRVDSRADIYSLGVVFYEMLTGELPSKTVTPPSKKVHIDVRLDEIVLRALEKTPELRWQSAADLRTQVETIVAESNSKAGATGQSPSPPGVTSTARRGRPGLKRVALWSCFVLVIFVGVAAVIKHLRSRIWPQSAFGPVIQRTIHDLDEARTNAALIDFDTAREFSVSNLNPENTPQSFVDDFESGLARMRRQGVDLWGDTSGKSFNGFDLVVFAVPQPFDELSAHDIALDKRLNRVAKAQTEVAVDDLPAVYLFKTREGGRGALEVVRFSTNLANMVFRYKMVARQITPAIPEGNLEATAPEKGVPLPSPDPITNVTPQPPEPSHYEFVRHLIILSHAGTNRFWSLEDAKPHPAPPDNSAVLYLETDSAFGRSIIVSNAHNYPTKKDRGIELWNSMSADDIAQPAGLAGLPMEREGTYALRPERLPITVLVPQYGLLQITSDDRTNQVLLEYKQTNRKPVEQPKRQGAN